MGYECFVTKTDTVRAARIMKTLAPDVVGLETPAIDGPPSSFDVGDI